MPLVQLESASLSFGEQHILDNANFVIEPGQKIALIGRNGEGKSTLLKILNQHMVLDSGRIIRQNGLKTATIEQELPARSRQTVDEYILSGLADTVADLRAFEELASTSPTDSRLTVLQGRLDASDGWSIKPRLERLMREFDFEYGRPLAEYSGGWRRKASIARALISEPDLLLLDEPTNHLDIGLIAWLEQFIQSSQSAMVLITHDRRFLRAVANQVLELDRGTLTSWSGSYDAFLVHKAAVLEAEERNNALFDKRLAEEEVWIRQGIKARRTRNEGRVRALKRLREERAARREKKSLGEIKIASDAVSGKLVAELEAVSVAFNEHLVIDNFSATIVRGDKIGLIGPNGAGKSTFLKLLLGELAPSKGQIRHGTKLSVAYYDQLREQLEPEKSILDNVAGGRDSVEIGGKTQHIMSYLADFMFDPKRVRTPVKALSGGERNRVMMAKLFCKSSNLLVLDEPTNDLDTDTLELLESLLVDYSGTVLLVSHDREFLDNVVTSTIAFEGEGRLNEYVGGYEDWIRQGGKWPSQKIAAKSKAKAQNEASPAPVALKKAAKLSYGLQRELDQLPDKLEKLEAEVARLNALICDPSFYQCSEEKVRLTLSELQAQEETLQAAYARWEELETASNPNG